MKNRWMLFSTVACGGILALILGFAAHKVEAAGGGRLDRAPVRADRGAALSATMAVTTTETRNAVGEAAATLAAMDGSELGVDFRLSSMGPDGNVNYNARDPEVAYNSSANEYLVVWSGADDTAGEYEIWGQRVNAATGAHIGVNFQISFMGSAGDPDYDAKDPDVAYNSASNEYLVVWSGDHYEDDDFEIFARRVDAGGTLLGSTMVRVSVMGSSVGSDYAARCPAVAYNSTANEYLVVWDGDDDTAPLENNEFEIWGQRLSASAERLADQLRLSDMGGLGDADYDAIDPDVAYNSQDNQYLVVWSGDDDTAPLVDDEFEIFGQRMNATLGGVGSNDFRISDMGGTGNADYDAFDPAIAYNSQNNQYLVVWRGDDFSPDVYDVFGQRMTATGGGVGANDFFLSNPGVGPNGDYNVYDPAVAYDQANNEYLVVWSDDELGAGEYEIWGQQVNAATGAAVGIDTRLSDMGADGNADYDARDPAVAYSGVSNNQYLVVWEGDDSTNDEYEIWGQRFTGASGYKVYLPLALRNH